MPDVIGLGRSVVVGPGQAPPPEWRDCERQVVAALDAHLAAELHAAWRARQALVLEVAPGIGLDDPVRPSPEVVIGRQPWEWPVDLDLPGERLHHAVWANSVDARGPGPLRWRWAEEACRAGARSPAPHHHGPDHHGPDHYDPDPQDPDRQGDVVLSDGRLVVCDGGPLDTGLSRRVGAEILHRISIEHGTLRPLGAPQDVTAGPLAPDQAAAVTEEVAGARVLAPAGAGKTRVLTERARALVRNWGLPPAGLALVAYNVRAATEMRERLGDLADLRVRTLNSLGLRLCGRSTTIEETEVRRILSRLVGFPRRAETDPAAPWIEALSRLRLGLAAPEVVQQEIVDVSDLDRVARAYRGVLEEGNAVDFDDQVAVAIGRLLADPAFRSRSQRSARVLLVDEFQDLTPAHLLLIRLLSGPAGAVFAVGDDDQTIYGYAGATPRWLVDFERWFPGSATHSLEVNYRCPAPVVAAASNLLSRNALRVGKAIRSSGGAEGELIVAPPGTGPASRSADRVSELVGGGAAPADIAVLSRVNASLVPVHVLLGHRHVAVNGAADRRFLQRGGVRGALAWLEVASAPESRLPGDALREAARRPKRGMGDGLLELLHRPRSLESLEGLSVWLENRGRARDATKVDQLTRDVMVVRAAARRSTAAVLRAVRTQVAGDGLDASASALDQWSHGAIAAHTDDLDALSELADLEPDPARFGAWLADRLGAGVQSQGVTLASIHAVKGREWPHVVLHHVTEGLLPHRLSGDLEEERRVFHVGLTRASQSVTLIPGPEPSPFILELDRPGRPVERFGGPRSRTTDPRPSVGKDRTPTARSARPTETPRRGASAGGPSELLPAGIGLRFRLGGQEHEIVEAAESAAMCLIGGGPGRTSVKFGTTVTRDGRPALLAHPAAGTAWEELRVWRSDKSRALGVPAYVVFDDSTLRLVAAHLPATEAGLLGLRGIGPAKLETYGSELLALTERLRSMGDWG